MKAPANAPKIYRDRLYIYLHWDSDTIVKFDATQGGLAKALKHVPIMEGSVAEFKRQLKPDWARNGVVQTKKPVPVKVAAKTTRQRQAANVSDKLRESVAESVMKIVKKHKEQI